MEFIDLQAQRQRLDSKIETRIKSVLAHGQFIMGPEVYQLEEVLADYVEVQHCVTCANGTDALSLALMALEIGPGDAVITTSFSFFATAEVISLQGATPVFADIDSRSFNLSAEQIERAVELAELHSLKPKAVIVADMFGLPADYRRLEPLCKRYGLTLIEDGAQSFGASYFGKKAGSFGDIATTSFFPAKPLGCYGDGGAVFTNTSELADRIRSLRLHGKGAHKYEHVDVGINSRLDTIQAAILLEKIEVLDDEINRRHNTAEFFNSHLGINFTVPTIQANYHSAWAQYSIYSEETNIWWQETLNKRDIPNAIYYPIPMNKQKAMQNALSLETKVCDSICKRVFSLPIHAYLTAIEKEQIVAALNAMDT